MRPVSTTLTTRSSSVTGWLAGSAGWLACVALGGGPAPSLSLSLEINPVNGSLPTTGSALSGVS